MSRHVIVTKRSVHRIGDICRCGTKRQRAKYRNALLTMCKDDRLVLGDDWGSRLPRQWRRIDRAERRLGSPLPIWSEDYSGHVEPMWHGVKGMVGAFWTLDPATGAWVGRAPGQ